jgi:hypothetical protein
MAIFNMALALAFLVSISTYALINFSKSADLTNEAKGELSSQSRYMKAKNLSELSSDSNSKNDIITISNNITYDDIVTSTDTQALANKLILKPSEMVDRMNMTDTGDYVIKSDKAIATQKIVRKRFEKNIDLTNDVFDVKPGMAATAMFEKRERVSGRISLKFEDYISTKNFISSANGNPLASQIIDSKNYYLALLTNQDILTPNDVSQLTQVAKSKLRLYIINQKKKYDLSPLVGAANYNDFKVYLKNTYNLTDVDLLIDTNFPG